MTWRHVSAGLVLLAGLSGCAVGPNYHPPRVPVPATWSETQPIAAFAVFVAK
jgi:outer membrane protein TolC